MGSMNQNAGDIFARLNPKAKRDAAIAGTVRPSGDEEYSRKFWGGAYDKNVAAIACCGYCAGAIRRNL